LKAFVDGFELSHERLLYGSDYPFTGTAFVEDFAQRMKEGLKELFGEEQRAKVYVGNAEGLLARKMVQEGG
jgi:predicted TIM-barrel fold metal-dependent hydrolase